MIFDKLILLWSITLILNFNGIVLCQEKDEHHLATECTNKSIKTFNLQNFPKLSIKSAVFQIMFVVINVLRNVFVVALLFLTLIICIVVLLKMKHVSLKVC